jgi:hypothetical protein
MRWVFEEKLPRLDIWPGETRTVNAVISANVSTEPYYDGSRRPKVEVTHVEIYETVYSHELRTTGERLIDYTEKLRQQYPKFIEELEVILAEKHYSEIVNHFTNRMIEGAG